MKSDKDVTKIKRVTFFLRHSVVLRTEVRLKQSLFTVVRHQGRSGTVIVIIIVDVVTNVTRTTATTSRTCAH